MRRKKETFSHLISQILTRCPAAAATRWLADEQVTLVTDWPFELVTSSSNDHVTNSWYSVTSNACKFPLSAVPVCMEVEINIIAPWPLCSNFEHITIKHNTGCANENNSIRLFQNIFPPYLQCLCLQIEDKATYCRPICENHLLKKMNNRLMW